MQSHSPHRQAKTEPLYHAEFATQISRDTRDPTTQNPRPIPREELVTQPRKIRDLPQPTKSWQRTTPTKTANPGLFDFSC